jgi:hypothetical protein
MSDTSPSDSIQRRQFVTRAASIVGASSLLGASALEASEVQEYCGKPQRAALEARVIARAWSDPRYLQALKRDPAGMLARELRTEVPREVRIQVLEERPDRLYLVVPVNPNHYSEKRLTEREMLGVASGIRFDTPCDSIASMMPAWFMQLQYFPRSRDVS